jgi:Pyruvate ferredoxin/flavodoxin oxidoreductase
MPTTEISIRPLSIRWHGRGGFGAKTAAALLAELIIDLGGYGQAAPEFGPERRGAPMQAYTRISPEPIRRRGPIETPDVLVVLDPRFAPDAHRDRPNFTVEGPGAEIHPAPCQAAHSHDPAVGMVASIFPPFHQCWSLDIKMRILGLARLCPGRGALRE